MNVLVAGATGAIGLPSSGGSWTPVTPSGRHMP